MQRVTYNNPSVTHTHTHKSISLLLIFLLLQFDEKRFKPDSYFVTFNKVHNKIESICYFIPLAVLCYPFEKIMSLNLYRMTESLDVLNFSK